MQPNAVTTQSYLTFRLGEESFAAHVSYVLEILEVTKITRVPRSPEYMRGVVNLRGNVLPVIDTRQKFGFETVADTVNTCIIVLNIETDKQKIMLGALVDSVQEVLDIDPATIQQPPSLGSKYRSEFIEGMVKEGDQFVMILNAALVFSTDEVTILREISETNDVNA